jgi:hypothetical protein
MRISLSLNLMFIIVDIALLSIYRHTPVGTTQSHELRESVFRMTDYWLQLPEMLASFLFGTTSKTAFYPLRTSSYFQRIKRPERENKYSASCNAEVAKSVSTNSTLPYVSMV